MIQIKCLNKNQGFFLSNMLARKIAPTISDFFKPFFFYKQVNKIGVEGFSEKPSTPMFFIYLCFIGAGGDENLKAYLAWPYLVQQMLN